MAYSANIPQAGDKLSVSQVDILNNFTQANTSFGIDHFEFDDGTSANGMHKQVTISDVTAPGAQTDPQSVIYTEAGTASTKAYAKFKNEDGVFPLAGIRAFATVNMTTGTGAKTVANGVNVSAVTRGSTTAVTFTLAANATTGTDYLVIFSDHPRGNNNYSLTKNAGNFVITYTNTIDNLVLDVMVIQV